MDYKLLFMLLQFQTELGELPDLDNTILATDFYLDEVKDIDYADSNCIYLHPSYFQ